MVRGKGKHESSEEEDVLIVEDTEIYEEEAFRKTLVGKIWMDNPYNVRAFKQTIVQACRLKNPVEVQELNRNLFLFKFTNRRDSETVLRTGPWSFNRNLVILTRTSDDEQPSELDMHIVSFWVRLYDLPLKLRSDAMAKNIGDKIGVFEEVDTRGNNRMGKSLRIKVALDLRKPLKRGITLRYQDRDLWIDFKYEHLPTFCYSCGKIGHQIKDCEDNEGVDEGSYSEIEEKDQSFGPWLRASPLPKYPTGGGTESNLSICSRALFVSTSNSKCVDSDEEKSNEVEVEQGKNKGAENEKGKVKQLEEKLELSKEVEGVAETLGTVAISTDFVVGICSTGEEGKKPKRKWNRAKGCRNSKSASGPKLAKALGKRQLVDVAISEGKVEDIQRVEKKRNVELMEVDSSERVVLESQYHLPQ